MDNKSISNWVRQARYRAKQHDIHTDLEVTDVYIIMAKHEGKCAYCNQEATTLDCPFPLKSNAPNVPANLLPICKEHKGIKKNNDLVWMFMEDHITNELYIRLLRELFERRGGDIIKEYVRLATGLVTEEK